MSQEFLSIEHPRFRRVEARIFTRRLVADCMTHGCGMLDTGAVRLDACCQYGCDVDRAERETIRAHREEIGALLRPEVRNAPGFESEEYVAADYPSGRVVRTALFEGGCIFLAHEDRERRGCAIHRASLERGFDLHGVKPAVRRLFPLSYEGGTILIAEEYPEFSCSRAEGPTLYRTARAALGDVFGEDVVRALDLAEERVAQRRAALARG